MAVITISRELGSMGRYISRQVADELGYAYIDKDIVAHILQQYGLVSFDKVYETSPGFWDRLDSMNYEVISMLNRVILAFAQQDNILIQGRGGYAILKEFRNVLNVRIQAPLDIRAQRVLERNNFENFEAAREFVKIDDKVRQSFLKTYYDIPWNDIYAFHLVFDTGQISPDNTIQWIAQAAEDIDQREILSTEDTKFINIDPVLAQTIQEALKKEMAAA